MKIIAALSAASSALASSAAGRDDSTYTYAAASSSQTLCRLANQDDRPGPAVVAEGDCLDLLASGTPAVPGTWTMDLAPGAGWMTVARTGACSVGVALRGDPGVDPVAQRGVRIGDGEINNVVKLTLQAPAGRNASSYLNATQGTLLGCGPGNATLLWQVSDMASEI